jgi:hypothetical protein
VPIPPHHRCPGADPAAPPARVLPSKGKMLDGTEDRWRSPVRARRLIQGAVAGGVATLVMSVAMFVFQRRGWLGRMPPRIIVEKTVRRGGAPPILARNISFWATIPAHFAFGMGQGVVYAALVDLLVTERSNVPPPPVNDDSPFPLKSLDRTRAHTGGRTSSVPSIPSAVAFGLVVWAASYAGWIPALGIMEPPGRDRPGRPTAMVVSHALFGLVLALVLRRFAPVDSNAKPQLLSQTSE